MNQKPRQFPDTICENMSLLTFLQQAPLEVTSRILSEAGLNATFNLAITCRTALSILENNPTLAKAPLIEYSFQDGFLTRKPNQSLISWYSQIRKHICVTCRQFITPECPRFLANQPYCAPCYEQLFHRAMMYDV